MSDDVSLYKHSGRRAGTPKSRSHRDTAGRDRPTTPPSLQVDQCTTQERDCRFAHELWNSFTYHVTIVLYHVRQLGKIATYSNNSNFCSCKVMLYVCSPPEFHTNKEGTSAVELRMATKTGCCCRHKIRNRLAFLKIMQESSFQAFHPDNNVPALSTRR